MDRWTCDLVCQPAQLGSAVPARWTNSAGQGVVACERLRPRLSEPHSASRNIAPCSQLVGHSAASRRTTTPRESVAPKATRFIFAVGMALTILAVMTWEVAAPNGSIYPIYQPQLLLLY